MLLKFVNVSKTYRTGNVTVHALVKASLEINKGEFVSIMGPSGSGKSTLMHLAGCLDIPTSGQIILNGKDVSSLSETELANIRSRKIGFVFQSFNLIPRTTVIDNVALPLVYTGSKQEERRQKALKNLAKVNLSDRALHTPGQLSGGEQQRAAIARALVNNPSVIFADEPTGNLDTKTSHEIMNLFTQLNREGRTIIIVTHEEDVAKFTKRTIRLKDGKIVEP